MKSSKSSGVLKLWFLIPMLTFVILFLFYPIIKTILLSFIQPNGDIGIGNYTFILSRSEFHKALFNTLAYTLVVTVFEMLIALLIAFFLTQKIKFTNFFQTIYFLPYVTSVIAIGTVFQVMYHTQYGVINGVLNAIGIDSIGWLTDPKMALISMIIFGVWKGLAFNILILFTGMTTIDQNLEKAALLDGFSPMQTFIKIKLPQIKPIIIYLLTINIIFNIKVYEVVVSLFGTIVPGPNFSANTIVYMLYQYSVTRPCDAAVLAVTLLIIVVSIRYAFKYLPLLFNTLKRGDA